MEASIREVRVFLAPSSILQHHVGVPMPLRLAFLCGLSFRRPPDEEPDSLQAHRALIEAQRAFWKVAVTNAAKNKRVLLLARLPRCLAAINSSLAPATSSRTRHRSSNFFARLGHLR